MRHHRGRHERGPVDPVRAFRRGWGRGVEPRVPAEGQFHGRVGEAAADLTRVGVLDRDPQVRGGLLVGGRVGPVEAQQPHIDVGELLAAAEDAEQFLLRPGRLLLDVQPGQHQRHRVPVAAEEVDRHLGRGRRRAAPGTGQPHPVRAVLRERDRVEVRDDIRVGVGRLGDLVEQLGGDGARRDQSAGVRMLGDHAAAVRRDLGDREARVTAVGDLVQEGVVAPGGLRAALDHVAREHGPGQLVEVLPAPAVPPGGRPGDERGVGDARADHDVGAGAERRGDAPAAEVGVRGDRLAPGAAQWLAGIQVGQRLPVREQLVESWEQVIAGDVGDLRMQAEALGERPELPGQARGIEAAGVVDDLDAAVEAGAEHVLQLGQRRCGRSPWPGPSAGPSTGSAWSARPGSRR